MKRNAPNAQVDDCRRGAGGRDRAGRVCAEQSGYAHRRQQGPHRGAGCRRAGARGGRGRNRRELVARHRRPPERVSGGRRPDLFDRGFRACRGRPAGRRAVAAAVPRHPGHPLRAPETGDSDRSGRGRTVQLREPDPGSGNGGSGRNRRATVRATATGRPAPAGRPARHRGRRGRFPRSAGRLRTPRQSDRIACARRQSRHAGQRETRSRAAFGPPERVRRFARRPARDRGGNAGPGSARWQPGIARARSGRPATRPARLGALRAAGAGPAAGRGRTGEPRSRGVGPHGQAPIFRRGPAGAHLRGGYAQPAARRQPGADNGRGHRSAGRPRDRRADVAGAGRGGAGARTHRAARDDAPGLGRGGTAARGCDGGGDARRIGVDGDGGRRGEHAAVRRSGIQGRGPTLASVRARRMDARGLGRSGIQDRGGPVARHRGRPIRLGRRAGDGPAPALRAGRGIVARRHGARRTVRPVPGRIRDHRAAAPAGRPAGRRGHHDLAGRPSQRPGLAAGHRITAYGPPGCKTGNRGGGGVRRLRDDVLDRRPRRATHRREAAGVRGHLDGSRPVRLRYRVPALFRAGAGRGFAAFRVLPLRPAVHSAEHRRDGDRQPADRRQRSGLGGDPSRLARGRSAGRGRRRGARRQRRRRRAVRPDRHSGAVVAHPATAPRPLSRGVHGAGYRVRRIRRALPHPRRQAERRAPAHRRARLPDSGGRHRRFRPAGRSGRVADALQRSVRGPDRHGEGTALHRGQGRTHRDSVRADRRGPEPAPGTERRTPRPPAAAGRNQGVGGKSPR